MDYSLEMILKYPLIKINLTEDRDIMLIEGKMLVHNRDFSITLKQFTLIDAKQKYNMERLESMHFGDTKQLLVKLNKNLKTATFENIVEVLDKVHEFLELETQTESLENHCEMYRKVLNEYSEFTKFFLNLKTCKLKEDLTRIEASVSDSKNREHFVQISIDYTKRTCDIFEISEIDLPVKDQGTFKCNESLVTLFDQLLGQIELLQPYFDLMEEFDRNATILDPDKPKRRDAYRRIWLEYLSLSQHIYLLLKFRFFLYNIIQELVIQKVILPLNARKFLGESISAIITVDPYNIFQRPDVKFLGPERLVETYNTHLNENLSKWVCQENIFQGILDLLGLEQFPKKEVSRKQERLLVEYGECSICFSLREDGKLPEIVCKNENCENFYHNKCLYYWLVSVNAKRVFNSICGNCPNCEKTISCPILY